MTTATIQDVPTNIIKDHGEVISYKTLEAEILKKKIWKIKQFFYNEQDETYWPFEGKQAIDFLNLLDYETSL